MTVLAAGWTDPSSLGYPVIFGGVLLGSIVPVVPTGAVVGAGAAPTRWRPTGRTPRRWSRGRRPSRTAPTSW